MIAQLSTRTCNFDMKDALEIELDMKDALEIELDKALEDASRQYST